MGSKAFAKFTFCFLFNEQNKKKKEFLAEVMGFSFFSHVAVSILDIYFMSVD